MNVRVKAADSFKRLAKSLLRKYQSLKAELEKLESELLSNPAMGTPLGNNAYKIRLAIRSKGKGKSGGARVITYLQSEIIVRTDVVKEKFTIVSLIAIYDKSEVESISNKELKIIIEQAERGF